MKAVGKYNVCKTISTLLTVGAPIITLCSCSDLFVHRSDTAISAAGIFAILLSALFLKDKIAENFKVPSAFVISAACLILLLLVESLIQPLKHVCIITLCTSGVDELTFKRLYKSMEATFPEKYKSYQFLGLMFTTTKTLMGDITDG